MKALQKILALSCALLVLACSESKKTAGVTEGGNTGAIAGVIVDAQGAVVPSALVRLRPAGYKAPIDTTALLAKSVSVLNDSLPIVDVYTDKNGAYLVDSLPLGDYSIEAQYEDASTGKILAVWRSASLLQYKEVRLPADTLRGAAKLRGIVPDSLLSLGYKYVQVVGLDRIEEVDEDNGEFEFDDLPPGVFQLRFIKNEDDGEPARVLDIELEEDEDDDLGEIEDSEEESEEDEVDDVVEE